MKFAEECRRLPSVIIDRRDFLVSYHQVAEECRQLLTLPNVIIDENVPVSYHKVAEECRRLPMIAERYYG